MLDTHFHSNLRSVNFEDKPSFNLLQELPNEIVCHIFSYLLPALHQSPKTSTTVCSIRQVSRWMNHQMMATYRRRLDKVAAYFFGPHLFQGKLSCLPQRPSIPNPIQGAVKASKASEASKSAAAAAAFLDRQLNPQQSSKNDYSHFASFLNSAYCPNPVKKLKLTYPSIDIKEAIALLSDPKIKELEHLKLKLKLDFEKREVEELMQTIASLKNLRSLKSSDLDKINCQASLTSLPCLESLEGRIESLSPRLIETLNRHPHLKRLNFQGPVQNLLAHLSTPLLQRIESLRLKTDASIEVEENCRTALTQMTSLKELSLEGGALFSSLFFSNQLPASDQLKALTVKQPIFIKMNMRWLTSFKNLEKISIKSAMWQGDSADSSLLEALAGKEHLRKISLSWRNLTSNGVLNALQAANCQKLEKLKFKCCESRNETLKQILQSYKIKRFSLTCFKKSLNPILQFAEKKSFKIEEEFKNSRERAEFINRL